MGLFNELIEIGQLGISKRPHICFLVVFPCNFQSPDQGPVRFANIDMEIHDLAFIRENFSSAVMLDALKKDPELKFSSFSYVVIEQMAGDEHEAIEMANDKVELFRSLLNFYKSYGRKVPSSGQSEHLSSIPPPKYAFVFNKDKEYLEMSGILEEYNYTIERFDDSEREQVDILVHSINKIKDFDLKVVVLRAMLKHNDALDESDPKMAYERYWHVLETLSLADGNEDSEETCRRISSMFEDRSDCPASQLCRKMESKAVRPVDVDKMKSLSQETIMFMLNNAGVIGGRRGLESFYRAH